MKKSIFLTLSSLIVAFTACEKDDTTSIQAVSDSIKSSENTTFEVANANILKQDDQLSLSIKGRSGETLVVNDLQSKIEESIGSRNVAETKSNGKFEVSANGSVQEVMYFNYNKNNSEPRVLLLPRRIIETIPLADGSTRKVKERFDYNDQNRLSRYRRIVFPPSDVDGLKTIVQRIFWNDDAISRIFQKSIFTDSEKTFNIIPQFEAGKISEFQFFNRNRLLEEVEEIAYQPNGDVNFKQRTVLDSDGNAQSIVFNQFRKDDTSNIKSIEASNIDVETLALGPVNFALNVEHEEDLSFHNYVVDLIGVTPELGLFIASPEFYSGRKNRIFETREFPIPTGDILQTRIDAVTTYNEDGYPLVSELTNTVTNVTQGFTLSTNVSEKVYNYVIALVY